MRLVVKRVDTALVAEAKALKGLLRSKLALRQLDNMHREAMTRREELAPTVVKDGMDWSLGIPAKHELIPIYRRQLDGVARRAWTDLVCTEDYFGPAGGMLRKEPLPEGTTEASMVVSLMPQLFHVGDSITRCLLQRVRTWTGFLAEARGVCYEAISRLNRPYEKQVEAERATWQEVQESTKDLQRLRLVGPEARIRESCITLVQVYAAFHPSPDLLGLAVPPSAMHPFCGQLRRNLWGF